MKRYTKPIHVPEVISHRAADSSLALINVVFLLLLFLLVSGTLRPPLPEDFDWAETTAETGSSNIQGSLALAQNGEIWFQGAPLDDVEFQKFLGEAEGRTDRLTIQVDKRAKMEAVASLAAKFKSTGIKHLTLVTIEVNQP
jgi:biopolymer transport protein ExbD